MGCFCSIYGCVCGYWLEARKALKRTKEEIFADYDKTMAEWEQGFQDAT